MPATCEVSVVIAAFNREALIERALRSVWSQTLAPAEVIVVDDCSSDDTATVARAAGAQVLRHRQNRGPAAARNTAIEAATQPWIAVLDSDDEWLPHHLATLWPLRDGHDLVAGSAIYSSSPEFPSRLAGWPRRRALLLRSPAQLLYPENPIPSTVLLNREAVRRAGGYDEQVWFVEDIDLYARVLERGSGLVAPIVTCVYRHHSGQATADLAYMHAQRRMLVERFAKRRWAKPGVLSRMQAVTEWDSLRLAIRQRSRSDCLRAGAWLAGHPTASLALVGLWSWRFQARRGGREQAALLRSGDLV
ncbi:MAG: glycosyltransferase family 2 protein [Solirubrobacterales bacterium]|nr:glycosyltransferase family 2 protein [Solirubrobacterales bacterium]